MAEPGPVVVNPSARARERAGRGRGAGGRTGPAPTSRCCRSGPGLPGSVHARRRHVRTMLGLLPGGPRSATTPGSTDVLVGGGRDRHRHHHRHRHARSGTASRSRRSSRTSTPGSAARPDAEVRVTLDQPPVRRIAGPSGRGARLRLVPLRAPPPWPTRSRGGVGEADGAGGASVTLTNGLVTVAVDPTDGTFALDGVPGYGRLVDGGDHGDSYNYSPPRQDAQRGHARRGVGDGRRARAGPGAWPPSPPPTPGPTTWTAPRKSRVGEPHRRR